MLYINIRPIQNNSYAYIFDSTTCLGPFWSKHRNQNIINTSYRSDFVFIFNVPTLRNNVHPLYGVAYNSEIENLIETKVTGDNVNSDKSPSSFQKKKIRI